MLFPPAGIGEFALPIVKTTIVPASAVQIAPASPSRVVLMLGCISGSVQISPNSNVTTISGITLSSGTLPLILTWQDHGALVTAAWFGVSTGAGFNVTSIEELWRPTEPESVRQAYPQITTGEQFADLLRKLNPDRPVT